MKDNISIKKPTFLLTLLVIFLSGFIAGIAFTTYNSSKTMAVNPAQKNRKGMEKAMLAQIKENPKNVKLLVQLGHFYFDNKMPKKAVEAYQKALKIKPDQPNVMTDMAVMYRRSGDSKKAVEVLDEVIRRFPTHQYARFNKGVILANDFNKRKEAVKMWEELLKMNPVFKAPDGQSLSAVIKHYKDGH